MGLKRYPSNNNMGNAFIAIGVILILFSVFQIFKWRIYQSDFVSNLIKEEIPVVSSSETNNKTEDSSNPLKEEFKIIIPKINVKALVINGTKKEDLKKGPGLYEISELPSKEGANVCIAAHRTTYGAWFRNVDKLIEGDEIALELGGDKYLYSVERVFIVAKNDWSVTKPTGYSSLTLTSCHPLRSAKQRIVVRAKLDKVEKNN